MNKAKDEDQEVETPLDENKLYLIPPTERTEPALPDHILDLITNKTIKKSKRLAKLARKEIEKDLNSVIFTQLEKVEDKFRLLKNFWELSKIQQDSLNQLKEECLAERVFLTALKTGQKIEEKPSSKEITIPRIGV